MKKQLLLALFALFIPWSVWAQSFTATTVEGVEMKFYITNSTTKECKVYGTSSSPSIPKNYSGTITIPEEVNGYNVTSIGNYAFYFCSSLTSVSIPEGVTIIGNNAFGGCSSLTSVSIPKGVTTIGSSTFNYCSSLSSVSIPEGVTTIGNNAFGGCSSLTSISIPEGVTTIDSYAFYNCNSLTSVSIPDGVTTIGNDAFSGCSNLKKVIAANIQSWLNIDFNDYYSNPLSYAGHLYINDQEVISVNVPAGVTVIKPYVFCNMKDLVSVKIPKGVTSVGSSAFDGCTGLVSISIPDGVTSIGNYAFCDCTGLVSISIPDGVTSIGNYAFQGCTGLVSISIPDGVTSIGNYAFYNCNGLMTVSIPNSVTTIGIYAFAKCSGIVSINIPDGLTNINDNTFSDCYGLTSINIPSSVTSIGRSAFNDCNKLTTVQIEEGLTTIDSYAFCWCSSLTSINLPSTLTSIESDAFYNCWNLQSIQIPSKITNIQAETFCYSGLQSMDIPSNVKVIGNKAFANSSLKQVSIAEGVTTISNYAFQSCGSLDSVSISSTIEVIGNYAFDGCNRLTKVSVGIGEPIAINASTFSNRSNATLYVPKGSKAAYQKADYWKEFKEIIEQDIQGTQENIMLINGIYFVLDDENGTATVVSGEEAYSGTVIIPASVTNEGKTYSVVSIGEGAFQNATGLTAISIPSSVTSIGDNAFVGCNNLISVTVAWETPIAINSTVFPNSGNATLHVPSGRESAYASAACWKDFKTIAEPIVFADNAVKALCLANWDADGDGVLYMDEAALVTDLDSVFTDNTDITTFDELQYFIGLTSIGERAFYYCSNLTSIVIPDNVTTIGNRAFYVCSGLTSLHISANVTNIEDRAFAYCSGLESIVVDDGNTVYDSRNDCNALIKTSNNTLLIGCKNTVIPSGVKILAEGSFRGCAELKNIEIPEGVTTIGASAFRGCTGLESVTLPSTISSIGTYAFSAFDEVYNLTTVTVGMTGPVTITSSVFPNRANSTLYVPKGSKAAYKAANYWKEFKQIIEIGETVVITDISDMDNAFYMDEKSVVPGNRYVLPIKLKNNQLVMGYQFDLELPEGVSFALDDNGKVIATMSDRGSTFSISKNKRSDRVCRFVVMDASNNVLTGEDGVVMNVTVDVADNIEVGVYGVVFKNGELTTKEDNAISSILLQNVTAPMNVVAALMGDVNNDGRVSVTDVVAIVGYILGNKFTNFVKAAADLNGDGSITVVDVVSVINLILNDDSYSKANALFEVEEE